MSFKCVHEICEATIGNGGIIFIMLLEKERDDDGVSDGLGGMIRPANSLKQHSPPCNRFGFDSNYLG